MSDLTPAAPEHIVNTLPGADDTVSLPAHEAATTYADAMAEPTAEEVAAVEAADGAAAAAVVDAAGPGVDAVPVDEAPTITYEDGVYRLGKYKGASVEELALNIDQGRRAVETFVGKKVEELDPSVNPFVKAPAAADDAVDLDGELVLTEAEYAASFSDELSKGITQALIAAGVAQAPVEPDPTAGYGQVLNIAQSAINSPDATSDDFRAVLGALWQTDPSKAADRQVVLEEWASRGPAEAIAAGQEAARIEATSIALQQELQRQGQQAAAEQAYHAELKELTDAEEATQAEVDAYNAAQTAFVERNPDWAEHNDVMNAWMAKRPGLLAKAKGDSEAVYDVFNAALEFAQAVAAQTPGAGNVAGVSEQGSNMGTVTNTDPNAEADERATIQNQLDLAGMESSGDAGVAGISVANPNPAGLAGTSTEDLIGIRSV